MIKDETFVSKIEGKTNFSRRLQTVRNRNCWVFGTVVGCNLKQFDGFTWLTLSPIFYDRTTPLNNPVISCYYVILCLSHICWTM